MDALAILALNFSCNLAMPRKKTFVKVAAGLLPVVSACMSSYVWQVDARLEPFISVLISPKGVCSFGSNNVPVFPPAFFGLVSLFIGKVIPLPFCNPPSFGSLVGSPCSKVAPMATPLTHKIININNRYFFILLMWLLGFHLVQQ